MSKNRQLYICWKNIRQRCSNSNSKRYKYYGGKGIKVCNEWDKYCEFEKWAISNGFVEGLTIDRINVNGDYEPNNCRWVDNYVQANNKTNNFLITYNNETKTIHQWAKIYNIKANTILMRLRRGWNINRALTEKPFIGKNQTYHLKDVSNSK